MTNSAPGANIPVGSAGSTRGRRLYALAGILFGAVFPIIGTAIRLWQRGDNLTWSGAIAAQRAEPLLWIIDSAPLFLGLLAWVAGARQDAVTDRNRKLLARERELTGIQTTLEQRVHQRTEDLEERNRELREAVLLTGRLSRIGDTSTLLESAAVSLADSMPSHSVAVYLLDSTGKYATLAASSSADDGRTGDARTVKVGDASVVGSVAASGRAITKRADLELMPSDYANALAFPLIVRGRVMGVLAIRPNPEAHIRRAPVPELVQLVADQLAASIDSTRLLDETRSALRELRLLSGQQTRDAWREFSPQRRVAFRYSPAGIRTTTAGLDAGGPEYLQAPLMLRGRRIGSITLRGDPRMPWSDGQRDLAIKVAAQAASALDNVRLLEASIQGAHKERRIGEITAKISGALNVRNVMQTAVEELSRALPGSEVILQLGRIKRDENEEAPT